MFFNNSYIKNNNNGIKIIDAKYLLENPNINFEENIDIITNVEDCYIRKVKIGLFSICEIIDNNLLNFIKVCKNRIFLYTGYKQWLLLRNRKIYTFDIEDKRKNVFVCKILSFDELMDMTCLRTCITNEGIKYYNSIEENIKKVKIIYARCVKSMYFLDKIHRKYLNKHKFKKNDIIAVKSVAGSGKTTTLLELAKIHKDKKILYLAFNRNLIAEIKKKKYDQKINNLVPTTFDSLMRNIFISNKKNEPNIVDIKTQNISKIIPWFDAKPYNIKQYYVKWFSKFCQQSEYNDINEFAINVIGSKKPLLFKMWNNTKNNTFHTFDSIRKHVQLNHWSKKYINENYDMIFIDEAQDFDNIMLKILLDDVTIPRLFVGDPKQAIYEWRGCINAFEKLPEKSLVYEFYSTFRIGNPACEKIRLMFENCWMISRSDNNTLLEYDKEVIEDYVYLFRSWKSLLLTAQKINKVWIYGYDNQVEYIRKLHAKLQISDLSKEDKEGFSDDLPAFLINMSCEDLEELLNNIDKNLVSKEESVCQLYTIHSYKGLENNIIKICNDIDINNEENIYYVALTRGLNNIILDGNEEDYKKQIEENKSESDSEENIENEIKTDCGHIIKIKKVMKKGGKMEGKAYIRITGPSINNKAGYKYLYSEPNMNKIIESYSKLLNL